MRIGMKKQMVKSRIITGQNFIADAQQKAKSKEAEEQVASKVQKALDGAATYEISEEGKARLKDQQRLMDETSAAKEEKKQVQEDFNPYAVNPKAAKSYQEEIRELRAVIKTKDEIREAGEEKIKEYKNQLDSLSAEDQSKIDAMRSKLKAVTNTELEEMQIKKAYDGAHKPEELLKVAMKGESILEPAEPPGQEQEQIKADEMDLLETYVDKRHEGEGMEEQIAPPEEDEQKTTQTKEREEAQEQAKEVKEQEAKREAEEADVLARPGVTLQELEEEKARRNTAGLAASAGLAGSV